MSAAASEGPAENLRRWYVLRAKPRRERFLTTQLTNQGLEVFYPAVRVQPVNPRAARERAYFPGYVFAHIELAAVGVMRLNHFPGALGLLQFGEEPALVPEALIAQLKSRMAVIQAAGGLTLADLKHGDGVKITDGPFAGYEAVFDLRLRGSDRVRVLLKILHREVTAEIDAGSVRKLRPSEKRATGQPGNP